METEVLMERVLLGGIVHQKSKSEFLSATDLVREGNKWRASEGLPYFSLANWKNSNQTKEFIHSLEKEFGSVCVNSRGRGHHTWVHPFLFIDLALAISPNLKIEVYKWLYDCLLKYRNDSGDSYKKMVGSLYANTTQRTYFSKSISDICHLIQSAVGVTDWQKATERELEYRDKIHEYISLMCGIFHNKNDEAVRVGLMKAKEWYDSKYGV